MTELRNEEPEFAKAESAAISKSSPSSPSSHAGIPENYAFVDDCALESDIEMYFPDHYVPSDSERMLLYRELDNLANSNHLDNDLEAYRKRLIDRFGAIPDVAEELINVVPLRALGKQLGIEKIILKQQKMFLYFVSNPDSLYYQSEAFGRILNYVSQHPRLCNFREVNGKRSIVIAPVASVMESLSICREVVTF